MVILPILFILFLIVDGLYGFVDKKRVCKKRTIISELFYFVHLLIMTYSTLSPFILKDYISNMMFNLVLLSVWFAEYKLYGIPVCYYADLNDRLCGNDKRTVEAVPIHYILVVSFIFLYDAYNIWN